MKKYFSILMVLGSNIFFCRAQENRPGVYFFSGPAKFVSQDLPAAQTQIFNDVKKYGYNADGSAIVAVNGSSFWNDDWYIGEMFDFQDSSYGYYPVKIDLLEGLVIFRNRIGTEMAVNEGKVKKVVIYEVIHDNDNANIRKIKAVFRYVPEVDAIINAKNILVQEMNRGNIKLLKVTKRNIESADSLLGSIKNYHYKDRYEYFLERGGRIEKLKKLNRENFLTLIPAASQYKVWINENNLKFRQQEDFINFLDYYNKHNRE
jgi:hypothetical protein